MALLLDLMVISMARQINWTEPPHSQAKKRAQAIILLFGLSLWRPAQRVDNFRLRQLI